MSNEKRDEFLSWRARLGQTEGVAGQGLEDREAAWDRLMERFREKPRRRLPVYAIVAACLLLALVPAVRMFQERSSHGTEVRHAHSPQAMPLAFRPETRHTLHSSPVSGIAPSAGKPDIRRTGRHTGSLPAREPLPSVAVVTDSSIHMPGAPTASLPAAPPLAQQVPVVRKKWKVVDLNELNSGWQLPHGMAANRLAGSIFIGVPGEAPVTENGPSPAREPGIKIKLPASN